MSTPTRSVRRRLNFDDVTNDPFVTPARVAAMATPERLAHLSARQDDEAPSTPVARAVPQLQSPPPIRRFVMSLEDTMRIVDFDEEIFQSLPPQPLNLTMRSAPEETQVRLMQARDNLLYEFRHEPAVIARISAALRLAGFVFE